MAAAGLSSEINTEALIIEACDKLRTCWEEPPNVDMEDGHVLAKAERRREKLEKMDRARPVRILIQELFGTFDNMRKREMVQGLLQTAVEDMVRQWPAWTWQEKLDACSTVEKLFKEIVLHEIIWDSLMKDERGLQYQLSTRIRLLLDQYNYRVEKSQPLAQPQGSHIPIMDCEGRRVCSIDLQEEPSGTLASGNQEVLVAAVTTEKVANQGQDDPPDRARYRVIFSTLPIGIDTESLAGTELVQDSEIRTRISNHTEERYFVRHIKIVKEQGRGN